MNPLRAIGFLACIAGLALPAHAQIVVYSFTGNTQAATTLHAQVTASTFGGSNGPTIGNGTPVFAAGSGSFFISQSAWTGAAPGTNYFEFTLTPSSGYSITLSSISFGSRSSGSGPINYSFRSSSDSYAADLVAGSFINDANWYWSGSQSITLTFAEPTTLRLYGYGAESSLGTLRIDDFTLNGSATAVPEPSTYAAVAGVIALGGALWHRRRRC